MAAVGHGGVALAAGPPLVGPQWASAVGSSAAKLSVRIDPDGSTATYHFEYTTEAAYQADLAVPGHDGFAGAKKAPVADATVGIGLVTVSHRCPRWPPEPATGTGQWRGTRIRPAPRSGRPEPSPPGPPGCCSRTTAAGRWSPRSTKTAARSTLPGAIAGGGVLQAAADGSSVTYGSAASFAGGSAGPRPASTSPCAAAPAGARRTSPRRSPTLRRRRRASPTSSSPPTSARGLLLNGDHCAAGVALPGRKPAAAGHRRAAGLPELLPARSAAASTPCWATADVAELDLDPADFDLRFAGASPTSTTSSSPAARRSPPPRPKSPGRRLRPGQPEPLRVVPGQRPDLDQRQLAGRGARRAGGRGLRQTAPASTSPWRATSSCARAAGRPNRSTPAAGEGGASRPPPPTAPSPSSSKAGHLWRYDAAADAGHRPHPGGRRVGVLGASPTAPPSTTWTPPALERWHERHRRRHRSRPAPTRPTPATTRRPPAPPGSAPTATSSSSSRTLSHRLTTATTTPTRSPASPTRGLPLRRHGRRSHLRLLQPDRRGARRPLDDPRRDRQRHRGRLRTQAYKPRVLSADGRRVFFDSARRRWRRPDTNGDDRRLPVGGRRASGSCAKAGGCVSLISSGRAAGGATFVDASADGSDVFFLTDGSLVGSRPRRARPLRRPGRRRLRRCPPADPLRRRRLPDPALRAGRPDR